MGAFCFAVGLVLASLSLLAPAAWGQVQDDFKGDCIGSLSAGVCTLDEPMGNSDATHGTVTYLRIGDVIYFTIDADDNITEVQICMQTSGPFEQLANACAGIHGHHVSFGVLGDVYSVDLDDEGFADSNPLYWTLHVVAGGRTLQVLSDETPEEPTTTTTVPETTTTTAQVTTTTVPETTTTTVPETTTTTAPVTTTTVPVTTTIPPTTTTAPPTTTTLPPTTTTLPPTTTTVPIVTTTIPIITTTTVPPTTTTTDPGETTTTIPATTTTTDPGETTTTTAPSTTTSSVLGQTVENTTTTIGTQVLGETLARTGGPRGITFLMGLALILLGAAIIGITRYDQPVYPEL